MNSPISPISSKSSCVPITSWSYRLLERWIIWRFKKNFTLCVAFHTVTTKEIWREKPFPFHSNLSTPMTTTSILQATWKSQPNLQERLVSRWNLPQSITNLSWSISETKLDVEDARFLLLDILNIQKESVDFKKSRQKW